MPGFEEDALRQREATAEEELTQAEESLAAFATKYRGKYPRGRRLGDGDRPSRRRIVLEEIDEGVTTLTAFMPEQVLHRVVTEDDTVYEYTVQDMLDEVGKVRED